MQFTYEYSIFDSDPSVSGPCAWPTHDGVELDAEDSADVLAVASEQARTLGERCGEYAPGDRLWIIVWDEDGTIVEEDTVDLDVEVTVDASDARPTETGVDRGVDVEFDLRAGKLRFAGEVTLLPHEDGSPGYSSWGQLDHWLDGRSVRAIRALNGSARDQVIQAIVDATSAQAAQVTP